MDIKTNIKPAIKLSVVNADSKDRAVLGRGVVALLLNVERYGSLNKAAKEMQMSYSKAWKLISKTEEALDIKLMIKKRPSGSELTDQGKLLAKTYTSLSTETQKFAEEKFAELLGQ